MEPRDHTPDDRLRVRRLPGDHPDLGLCLEVRRVVFIEEQGVPVPEEVDGRDPGCLHLLAERPLPGGGWEPVGTARLREPGGGGAKAERVAVLRGLRGQGVGRALMRALEDAARQRGHARVVLGAQTEAIPFYERLGYAAYGEVFMDAGIPHRMMALDL